VWTGGGASVVIVIALDFTGLAERLQRAYALKDGESCIERLIRPQGHALKHQNPCDDGVNSGFPPKKNMVIWCMRVHIIADKLISLQDFAVPRPHSHSLPLQHRSMSRGCSVLFCTHVTIVANR